MTLDEKLRRFDELTAQAGVVITYIDNINTVYFSNEQAVKESAAWLNELCAKGDL